MDIAEMKKNLSLIDKLLERANSPVQIDTQRVHTAKSKLEKKFFEAIKVNTLICVIFLIIWLKDGNDINISIPYRLIISIVTFIGSLWYLYLYQAVKRIDIYTLTPRQLFSKISGLKLKIYSGEIAIGMILVILFTLFLPQIFQASLLGFWLCIITICFAIAISLIVYIPRYKKIFNDLTAIKN
ncbi:MAG: hypothetical protein J1F20_01295 [Muribaculaceae bacterium]|nr:hypothetical protein [Muribaculaceae bacterium]